MIISSLYDAVSLLNIYERRNLDSLHQFESSFQFSYHCHFKLVCFVSENMNTVMAIILPVPGKRALDLLHR
jgi:hypothetical protein